MADEPTAIRHAVRFPGSDHLWHRPDLLGEATVIPACWGPGRGDPIFAAVTDTNPEDRCRTCWPTTKETR